LLPARDALIRAGDAEMVTELFLGYEQHRLTPRRPADTTAFTEDEPETIDRVIDDLRSLTAKQVSDLSHAEPGWRLVDNGETIPYETAFIAPAHVETATSRELVRAVVAHYDVSIA
jgi:hypothetical protein